MYFKKDLFAEGFHTLIPREVEIGDILVLSRNRFFYVDDIDSEFINDQVADMYIDTESDELEDPTDEDVLPEHEKFHFYDEENKSIRNVPGRTEIIVYRRVIGNHNRRNAYLSDAWYCLPAGAIHWLANGEHGISSKTLFSVLSGLNIMAGWGYCHPLDGDDFRRCYLLIESCPRWKDELPKMMQVSPQWSEVVDNWDKLSDYLRQSQTSMEKATEMYEFMKEIGC
jgi:hypothetical protein